MNNNKDNGNQPILLKNPNTGKWVNMTALLDLESSVSASFPDLASNMEQNVIRFINENCIIEDQGGKGAQDMFFVLYQIMDAFRGSVQVEC